MTPESVALPTPASDPQTLPKARLQAELAWNLFTELRKELVEAQSLRTRVIGLKVTFVSAAAAVVAGLNHPEPLLLAIPAVAAVFFDVLINSYSFSVKRIGTYAREFLEPVLRKGYGFDPATPLWQGFLKRRSARQPWATLANLGMTLLACAAAGAALYPFRPGMPRALLIVLLALLIFDVWLSWHIRALDFPADPEKKSSRGVRVFALFGRKPRTVQPARPESEGEVKKLRDG